MVSKIQKIQEQDLVRGEEDTLIDFQFAVIDALNEQQLSHAEFATLLGVSKARVSQILSSEANPTIKLVGRICNILGLEARFKAPDIRDEYPIFNARHHTLQENLEPSGSWIRAAGFMDTLSNQWACNDNLAEQRQTRAREIA